MINQGIVQNATDGLFNYKKPRMIA